MKTRTALLTILVLLLGMLGIAPASADDGIRPTFRTEDVWFHCTGTTKIYQVNWLSTIGNASTYAPWDTTPPAGSVTSGAGCGAADVGGTTNLFYGPVFHGYFEGNLRDMTVEIHSLLLSHARDGQPVELAVHLEIDGQAVFPPGVTEGGRVVVTPVTSSTGASEMFKFTITDLGFSEDQFDADGNLIGVEHGGFAIEDGNGTREREILLMIGNGVWPQPGAWVWDTTEVPSGITFNPEERAAASLRAQTPRTSAAGSEAVASLTGGR